MLTPEQRANMAANRAADYRTEARSHRKEATDLLLAGQRKKAVAGFRAAAEAMEQAAGEDETAAEAYESASKSAAHRARADRLAARSDHGEAARAEAPRDY